MLLLYSYPNLMTLTCWGLAQIQKAEPDNPHYDPEELFSSPPIYQKFTSFFQKPPRWDNVFLDLLQLLQRLSCHHLVLN